MSRHLSWETIEYIDILMCVWFWGVEVEGGVNGCHPCLFLWEGDGESESEWKVENF